MGALGSTTLDPVAESAPPRAAALVLRNVHKSFGARSVLAGVDLTVDSGTLVSITGPNGAGKTTLLRLAAGLLAPDSGSIAVCGLDSERDGGAYRSRIGLLSAGDRGLYPRLTVARNLEFAARLGMLARPRLGPAVEEAIDGFGLGELAARRVDRLSTGQRQRVRLAATLIHDPALVLLDEPANSLDDAGIATLEEALADVALRGGAVVSCVPSGAEKTLSADRCYAVCEGGLEAA
jgi:ABC-type multidrug transport system ATPase subunit